MIPFDFKSYNKRNFKDYPLIASIFDKLRIPSSTIPDLDIAGKNSLIKNINECADDAVLKQLLRGAGFPEIDISDANIKSIKQEIYTNALDPRIRSLIIEALSGRPLHAFGLSTTALDTLSDTSKTVLSGFSSPTAMYKATKSAIMNPLASMAYIAKSATEIGRKALESAAFAASGKSTTLNTIAALSAACTKQDENSIKACLESLGFLATSLDQLTKKVLQAVRNPLAVSTSPLQLQSAEQSPQPSIAPSPPQPQSTEESPPPPPPLPPPLPPSPQILRPKPIRKGGRVGGPEERPTSTESPSRPPTADQLALAQSKLRPTPKPSTTPQTSRLPFSAFDLTSVKLQSSDLRKPSAELPKPTPKPVDEVDRIQRLIATKKRRLQEQGSEIEQLEKEISSKSIAFEKKKKAGGNVVQDHKELSGLTSQLVKLKGDREAQHREIGAAQEKLSKLSPPGVSAHTGSPPIESPAPTQSMKLSDSPAQAEKSSVEDKVDAQGEFEGGPDKDIRKGSLKP